LTLPEIKELEEIFRREAQRPIAVEKKSEHFANFNLVVRWLNELELPVDGFREGIRWQDSIVQFMDHDLSSRVAKKTLEKLRKGDSELETILSHVTAYLGEEDVPLSSDAIFVFGSKNLARIETAANLWKQELSPVIFISGGMPIYEQREKSEALIFKEWAIKHGIPESALAVHSTAISVADNVRGGLNEMDRLGLVHDSLILVTAWFAMRRSWAHMMKYVSLETKLYRVNAPVKMGGNYDPALWWKNENGIKIVFNEFAKMKMSEALNTS
jgi:hypothetical protein